MGPKSNTPFPASEAFSDNRQPSSPMEPIRIQFYLLALALGLALNVAPHAADVSPAETKAIAEQLTN